MRKRLALTISGAVSLGSYEAGVMYELISAFDEHNQTTANEEEKFEIDVLTGASAGGMTAAIAAQKLLYDAPALAGADANALYLPWVQDVSLQALLSGKDDPRFSILSSDLVESIARKYLTDRYSSGAPTTRVRRHLAAAASIKLGLAMSNLNGVDYSTPLQTGGDFTYTCFEDQFLRSVSANAADDALSVWDPIRLAALGCGAFPLAFRVQEIPRKSSEFPGANFPNPNLEFAYTDGGVFDNEPLGIAKNLVDEIDSHENLDSRFFLYISPHSNNSSVDRDFNAAAAMLFPTVKQLVAAMYHQAQFQDWVTAEAVNQRIRLLNTRAKELQECLIKQTITKAQLTPASDAILNLLFPDDKTNDVRSAAKERLKRQFATETGELTRAFPNDPSIADAWAAAILVLEKSADLSDKDEMQIYGITALNDDLAGNQFLSFGGFFDLKYRQHDYDRGRTNARIFLQQHVNDSGQGTFGPIRCSFPPFTPVQIPIPKTIKDLDPTLRKELRDRVYDRAKKMLTSAGVGGIEKWLITTFYLSGKLNEIFGL